MSDTSSILGSLLSVDEILTPQFLYPVCGVIICAVAVFLVGVGFKSSSEPKFQISGDGDGVPFLKKKKKQKGSNERPLLSKKSQAITAAPSKQRGRRSEDYFDRETPSLYQTTERNAADLTTNVTADEWITPVSRKEKKARRKQETVTEADRSDRIESIRNTTTSPVEKDEEVMVATEIKVNAAPVPQLSSTEESSRGSPKEGTEEELKEPLKEQEKIEPEKENKKEDDKKSKRSSKQIRNQTVESSVTMKTAAEMSKPETVATEPTTSTASVVAPTLSKKKKKVTSGTGAAADAAGSFQLAEFELPTAVTSSVSHNSPSPPSTDSSFELVDAEAVREAFEEVEEEKAVRSRTSGASKKKNRKPAAVKPSDGGGDTVVEKIMEKATPAPVTTIADEPKTTSESIQPVVSENAHEWQDAKSTRKRRRVRRDD